MAELIDLLLHVDRYLLDLVANYGVWVYAILFVIVFAETGLVVTPFLPGDSLLFAAGALAATGALNIWVAVILLLAAAVAGDAVNYAVGRSAGLRVIELSQTDPTLEALDQSGLHRARARVLRAARRQGHRAGTVHADRPHVRSLRRRRRRDVLRRRSRSTT